MPAVRRRAIVAAASLAAGVGVPWRAFAQAAPPASPAFEIHGHRGARGLAPENTLAAFRRGLAAGSDVLELDVLLTADDVPVVHHDPALNADLARTADGRWIEAPGPAIRTLTRAQLQAWDVGRARPGSRIANDYAEQQPADGERIPTLAQVLALGSPQTRFNVEIKHDPRSPELFAPIDAAVDGVLRAFADAGVQGRVLLQSFNWAVLQRAQQVAPTLPTSYLSMQRPNANTIDAPGWTAGFKLSEHGSVPRMVRAAGGRWWSPNFRDLSPALVQEAQGLGLKVAAWTVNAPADLERVAALGVDAIITDYPDRASALRAARAGKR